MSKCPFPVSTRSHLLAVLIQGILGVKIEEKHEKYLGLPSVIGKSKKDVFAYIRDRSWERLQGRKEQKLSSAGKEVLLKAVIQAIPSYSMSCFKLPESLISELESMASKFWWRAGNQRKLHWIAWRKLCRGKKEGGLGFRDLRAFNMALLAKQAWRILRYPDSLVGQIFKAKYFSDRSLLDARLGSSPSFTWKCLHEAIPLLKSGLRWRVGNGDKIRVWDDPWLPRPITFRIITPKPVEEVDRTVSTLIHQDTGQWNAELLREVFWVEDVECILSIPLGSQDNIDQLIWHYTANGIFSVRSAYFLALQSGVGRRRVEDGGSSSSPEDWSFLWKIRCPNKINIFLWRLCHDILPTRCKLRQRKIIAETLCPVCECGDEDLRHCFGSCRLSRQVWTLLNVAKSQQIREFEDGITWLRRCANSLSRDEVSKIGIACWAIWNNRNRIVAGEQPSTPEATANFISSFFQAWESGTSARTVEPLSQPSISWFPQHTRGIRVLFDGAIFAMECSSGIGIYAETEEGKCIAKISKRFTGNLGSRNIEAKAALIAVQTAIRKQWRVVMFMGDCLGIIHDITSKECIEADHANLIKDVKRLVEQNSYFAFRWHCREKNAAAHQLARGATQDSEWFEQEKPG